MIESNKIKLHPIAINDFKTILEWSQNDTFCKAYGWDLNKDREELYIWWENLVNRPSKGFLRLGIERKGQLIAMQT
ncbi:hypothetical protein GCM10008932_15890 [Alkalibacterium iburiense]|uniref:N-acetyltransferase domain-containing protein n=1 Tax=Alkalibacterium iburiense TaxID=290589 RepID=A0ABN0XHK5_9LACT